MDAVTPPPGRPFLRGRSGSLSEAEVKALLDVALRVSAGAALGSLMGVVVASTVILPATLSLTFPALCAVVAGGIGLITSRKRSR